jgi:hypothetical protein
VENLLTAICGVSLGTLLTVIFITVKERKCLTRKKFILKLCSLVFLACTVVLIHLSIQ